MSSTFFCVNWIQKIRKIEGIELLILMKQNEHTLEKEYCERKTSLSNWGGQSIHIKERLKGYILLSKHNRHLTTSEERLVTMSTINEDEVIIDYLHTQQYANTQVKESDDFLSEQEYLYCEKIDKLANYILYPDQKQHGILTNNQKCNVGRTNDENRESFQRLVPLYNTDITSNNIYSNIGDATERDMNNEIEADLSRVQLSNPEHVKALLYKYSHWRELLYEQRNTDGEFAELLNRLDLLIETTNFSHIEMYIISLVKQSKYNHKQVLEQVNKKFGNVYTYKQVNYAITEKIPSRIAQVAARIEKALNSKNIY